MEIKGVANPSVTGGNDERLSGADEAHVAHEAFIEDAVDGCTIMRAMLRSPYQLGAGREQTVRVG